MPTLLNGGMFLALIPLAVLFFLAVTVPAAAQTPAPPAPAPQPHEKLEKEQCHRPALRYLTPAFNGNGVP